MCRSANHGYGPLMLGFTLSAGLVISTLLATKSVEKVKISNQKFRVKGYAQKGITSDWAEWNGKFSTRADILVEAYTKMEKDLAVIIGWLEKEGITRERISITSVSTSLLYKTDKQGRNTNEIEGYRLSQSIGLNGPDVELIARIASESTTLIKLGVQFESMTPSYFYTKINDLKIEMLGEAARNARLRAQQLVENSGSRIGRLKYASQGVFQITPAFSTDVSDYGSYDTGTINKSIKAVVTMEYSID